MKKIVVQSINDQTGMFCVDILSNAEQRFSFKGFRHDQEDNSGWYAFGPESDFVYLTSQEALDAAVKVIPWLKQ